MEGSMTTEHKIETILDVLKLSPEEFARFLPDLVAWHEIGREMQAIGAEMTGMVWRDDGKPGEIHSVTAHIMDGDKELRVETWPGSAYTEAP
jgi:nitroreductase